MAATRKTSVLVWVLITAVLVHAQDQSGFISIDCGSSVAYKDEVTGIDYVPDSNYIETGESKNISDSQNQGNLVRQLKSVRSLPDGVRNCYSLRNGAISANGRRLLMRAQFMYGNYDLKNQVPEFDLYIGVNLWAVIKLDGIWNVTSVEMIFSTSSAVSTVCLVNKGLGTPFISVLESRVLDNAAYVPEVPGSLNLVTRANIVSGSKTKYRFPDDVYDRIWEPTELSGEMKYISTNQTIYTNDWFDPPQSVMSTAVTASTASGKIDFHLETSKNSGELQYYSCMYICELQILEPLNQTREFYIYLNDVWGYGPYSPPYLSVETLWDTEPYSTQEFNFSVTRTVNSTLPPLLNAFEIYSFVPLSQSETVAEEVKAINAIKSYYGVRKFWQGDPCAPKNYSWEGLACSFNGFDPPRIISLNLSSSDLTGPISTSIAKLKSLEHLDLSKNKLSWTIPVFLSSMTSLKFLNLSGNNFTGTVPSSLVRRSKEGSLILSLEGNPNVCLSDTCNPPNKPNVVLPVVASVAGVFGFLLIVFIVFYIYKNKKKNSKGEEINKETGMYHPGGPTRDVLKKNKQRFTYSEVLKITGKFQKVIGLGGFGTVFHGYLDGAQVAVKMLSASSLQGYKEFEAEAKLLTRVYHRNLTSLIGYCDEDDKLGLIYEFMANGNLESQLSVRNSHYLTWEDRLHIAIDAAQGLDYLHNGCKPPIVHRDVKTTNILLNENFQAKLADFGLSRVYPADGSNNHVSTVVAGTPGYLDPEYYRTQRLHEKSDVYSFGVVLLEIISSKPMRSRTEDRTHIATWVDKVLRDTGNVKAIIDHRLGDDYDLNSVWNAVELAMACVSSASSRRPSMTQVVNELKQSLDMEKGRKMERLTDGTVEISMDQLDFDYSSEQPLAR
ncbi:hypothetical protein QQ045_015943 [Rhodiola kirilowii]